MCAEHDGHVIAAAGYSEHATADGRGVLAFVEILFSRHDEPRTASAH
jgi:hypothetical protein